MLMSLIGFLMIIVPYALIIIGLILAIKLLIWLSKNK